MRRKALTIISIVLVAFSLQSCRHESVDGIIIGSDLYRMQTPSENRKLCNIVQRVLNKDREALGELMGYWCGGGAGCYDLGYVTTQIICKLGENEFIKLCDGLSKDKKAVLLGLVCAGLEYGDNNYDDKMDDTTIDAAFPSLEQTLTK